MIIPSLINNLGPIIEVRNLTKIFGPRPLKTLSHLQRGCSVRISREGEQIFEGKLASLKRFKDDAKEVKAGFECGLVFEGFDAVQELDVVEAYTMVEVPR